MFYQKCDFGGKGDTMVKIIKLNIRCCLSVTEAASYSKWDNHHMPVPEQCCAHWRLCDFDRPNKGLWHCPPRSDCHNKYREGSIATFRGLLGHSGTVFLSIKLQMDQVKPLKSSVSALHLQLVVSIVYCGPAWMVETMYFAQLSALVTPRHSREALSCGSQDSNSHML